MPGRENADRLLSFVAELRDIRKCAASQFLRTQWKHKLWYGAETGVWLRSECYRMCSCTPLLLGHVPSDPGVAFKLICACVPSLAEKQ